MIIDKYGEIAEKDWFKTGELRNNIKSHEFIIMPNHLHGIVEIVNCRNVECRGTARRALVKELCAQSKDHFGKPSSNTIPTIIRSSKGAGKKKQKAGK